MQLQCYSNFFFASFTVLFLCMFSAYSQSQCDVLLDFVMILLHIQGQFFGQFTPITEMLPIRFKSLNDRLRLLGLNVIFTKLF